MATRYFIENKNGTILSEDGTRRFIVLEGKELYDYLQTKEGKKKRFFVYQDDDGDTIGVEEVENTTKGETKGERIINLPESLKQGTAVLMEDRNA